MTNMLYGYDVVEPEAILGSQIYICGEVGSRLLAVFGNTILVPNVYISRYSWVESVDDAIVFEIDEGTMTIIVYSGDYVLFQSPYDYSVAIIDPNILTNLLLGLQGKGIEKIAI